MGLLFIDFAGLSRSTSLRYRDYDVVSEIGASELWISAFEFLPTAQRAQA